MSSSAKRIRLETAATQGTTIEKLCDDVLAEIFSYLSAEELKSASLVCKHWNEMIGSSAGTMKKFKLKLKESELIGRQFSSSRNYQIIELEMLATEDGPPSDQKALENLNHLFELSQLKYFKIFAYNPEAGSGKAFTVCFVDNPWPDFSIDAMKLTAALKQMKQLQELFIECLAGFRGSFTSTVDLTKLTKLAMKSRDSSIFQWISARNVTEIDLIHEFSRTADQHVVSFLKLCKQITTLKLDSSVLRVLFENGKWKDFNLKLSDLHVNINRNPDAISLGEFLMSQAPNLTSLTMNNFTLLLPEKDSVIEAVGQLKNLKILSLDHCSWPNVTFLKKLTELEQLTLDKVNDINSIARFNRKLTYLKIENISGSSLDATLKFSELKHLCVWVAVDPSSNCLKVIKSSPKIETIELRLSLGYRADANRCDEIIEAALQQPTLRHLKLKFCNSGFNFGLLEEVFDTITSDYGNLKSLSLSKELGSRLKLVELEFVFPENRSDWKADEQKMRLRETFDFN